MGVKFDAITNRTVGIGDNEFESATITVGAEQTVKAGTLLKRTGDSKKFEAAKQGDTFSAVMPFDISNSGKTNSEMGLRVLIGGKVRRDTLAVDGSPVTNVQADALRDYGITAVETTDVSRV